MLGVSPQNWPRNGEIDIMEMGHPPLPTARVRGSTTLSAPTSSPTSRPLACPATRAALHSTAWNTKSYYVAPTSMANRFITYRLYWTESQMRFTAVDNGVEHNLYDNVLPVNSTSLQEPFYLLLNLAVGGNFTDAASPGQVTAPLPGTMYVDYVRVYELDGKGSVSIGNQTKPEVGKFGVFTDLTAVNNKQTA
ncbi:glycoside hydrolase family 16 protein [Massilia sp. H-1]|nr:glycoside hydrolase family 16 protein [Massilia sp. H-1]